MPRIDESESRLLLIIIVGAFVVGLGLAALGIYLVTLGGSGESVIELLGQNINSKNAGVTSIFIGATLIIFLVRPAYKVIMRPQIQHDNLLTLYRQFEVGASSPTENAALIERIANSNNPNKKEYLFQAAQVPHISFMETDAINLAISDIDRGVKVLDLLKRCRETELPKILAMVPDTDDPLFKKIVVTFKYDRYVARKDSPHYHKINEFLAESLAHGRFTDKALRLSKQLEQEMKSGQLKLESNVLDSLVKPLSSDNESSMEENKFRKLAISLASKGDYSNCMDAANAALLRNQALVADAKFTFALARCSAALGDMQTSLMALQVLAAKNPAAVNDPEFASTIMFLQEKGLTAENLKSMLG